MTRNGVRDIGNTALGTHGALKICKCVEVSPKLLKIVHRRCAGCLVAAKAENELLLPVDSRLRERQRKNVAFSRLTNVDEGVKDHTNAVGAVYAVARGQKVRNAFNSGKVQVTTGVLVGDAPLFVLAREDVVVQGVKGIVAIKIHTGQIHRANGQVAVSGVRGSRKWSGRGWQEVGMTLT